MELLMLASFLLTDKGFPCFFHDSFLRPVILGSFTRVPLFFFFKSLLNLLQHCFCFMFLFFGQEACGILASRLGIEPTIPALGGSLNHWTTRGVQKCLLQLP